MAWGGWGFNPDPPKEEKSDRDAELENLLGNLLVAKYQVARLEDKLTNRVGNGHSDSKFMFKHGERWYQVTIHIDRQEEIKKEEEPEPQKVEPHGIDCDCEGCTGINP